MTTQVQHTDEKPTTYQAARAAAGSPGAIRIDKPFGPYKRLDAAERFANGDAQGIHSVLSECLPAITYDALFDLMCEARLAEGWTLDARPRPEIEEEQCDNALT